jgi:threonine/homoserine/homoserine lactone efflux protein
MELEDLDTALIAALGTVIVTSLSGVMAPGPMFAVTLAKSLKSPWAGALVSLGHAVIEVPLILLVYFGLARFFENEVVGLVLSILGGAMIVWMGYSLFRVRKELSREGRDTTYNAFMAGILMSGLNPFFLVWWVTVGSLLLRTFLDAVGEWALPLFIIVHWLCDLVWLSLVSVVIFKTRSFWKPRAQELVFVILSAALYYFGGYFIVNGIDVYAGINMWEWFQYVLGILLAVYILYWLWYYLKKNKSEKLVRY